MRGGDGLVLRKGPHLFRLQIKGTACTCTPAGETTILPVYGAEAGPNEDEEGSVEREEAAGRVLLAGG